MKKIRGTYKSKCCNEILYIKGEEAGFSIRCTKCERVCEEDKKLKVKK